MNPLYTSEVYKGFVKYYALSMSRKYPIETGAIYHVMNKSIEGYRIYNNPADFQRFLFTIQYFQLAHPPTKFSFFLSRYPKVQEDGIEKTLHELTQENKRMVSLIAYCIMPTHFHLILKQVSSNGISIFMQNSLNSYARYFNTKYKRKGTLWMSRFKNVLVDSDEQLLHLTRYIHLNPVTAGIIQSPENWKYSSYEEYTSKKRVTQSRVQFKSLIDMPPEDYAAFVNDHIDYQRELANIRQQTLE